ncbi:MAG: Methyltransferase type 12 [Bryobacterales bacterium]|nr:Methyltransferase type 12 [Bryobacterales bacterium]
MTTSDSGVRLQRNCPICGESHGRRLVHQSFEPLSGVTFVESYYVVVCVHCGFGFADGIPTQDVFDAYYRDLSKYEHQHSGGKESVSDAHRLRETAATITQVIPSPAARVLEIGCATGKLLSLIREAGFQEIRGLDPSPGCAQAAWELYSVPVLTSSLFSIPSPEKPYDFIILIAVLEHVEDLRKALDCVRGVLAPNGRVFAEVPDGSRLAGRPDAPYQEFSNEHINFFSTVSLSNLFKANGFGVVSTGEGVREQCENTICNVAFGVYQKTEAPQELEPDNVTEPGLRRYIEESAATDRRVCQAIQDGARDRDLLVWGTGAHTRRLLAKGAFEGIRIAAFIDSNPQYQGRELQGVPVVSPRSLAGRTEPILISTRGFQREIRDQIRGQLRLTNEVIMLYEG